VTRNELKDQINEILYGPGERDLVNSERVTNFILEHFQEKPRPSARERLKTLLCDRIPGVRLGDEDTVALYLLDECKELLSILEQHSKEVLQEAIARNVRGFGV